MAENKQNNGCDDKQNETRFQSSQASFLLVEIKQIRESVNLMPECNLTDMLKLAKNIVKLSNTLENYIKIDETSVVEKEQMTGCSRTIKKMKKKGKRFYYFYLKTKGWLSLQRILQQE